MPTSLPRAGFFTPEHRPGLLLQNHPRPCPAPSNNNEKRPFWGVCFVWCRIKKDHLRNLCISRQRMCLHMRAGCGSIPAYAAI